MHWHFILLLSLELQIVFAQCLVYLKKKQHFHVKHLVESFNIQSRCILAHTLLNRLVFSQVKDKSDFNAFVASRNVFNKKGTEKDSERSQFSESFIYYNGRSLS